MDKKINIKKIVLATVATAGIIAVVAVAPNALQVIRQFSGNDKYRRKKRINSTTEALIKKGYLKFEEKDGGKFLRLTKKGDDELFKYEMGDLEIKRPNKWDGKWRVVVFDIKEARRKTRDNLRFTLERLGFVKLQNSVWVFPYDCEELIVMLKSSLFIGKDVLYMRADSIENDRWLKELYGLE